MIYLGDDKLDFSDTELILFMQTATNGASWQPLFTDAPGYSQSSKAKPIELGAAPAPTEGFAVRWTVLETWGVFEKTNTGEQKVLETTIRIFAGRPVEVSLSIQLLLRDGLSDAIQTKIEAVFSAYQYPASGDVDTYIEEAIANDSSLNLLMIGLAKRITVTAVADAVYDRSAYENLLRWISENQEGEQYRLVRLSSNELDRVDIPPKDKNQTELGDPKKAAEQIAEQEQERARCEHFETRTWKVARTDWIPETRWTWGWHLVHSGCVYLHLYYPTTETRDVDLVAEVWVTIPDGLKPVEAAIRKCAEEASLSAAVYFIIFSDLTSALIAFRALFVECIKGKFSEALTCVNAGIVVDTRPAGPWH
ncbi:hypothetical protein ELH43_22235 [Rhizobium ruizarguesonis]|uniref:hypothetical protein n=1 Tax=Rhizobium ruizarguesonis TaxID=2081791 RepID=UPI0010302D50|nr:hypothetical protein [Rhizobium ruizarguesonis]TBB77941.1 hypothetical protein ELH43_22235 [Rhizobium ruizarguesonis]